MHGTETLGWLLTTRDAWVFLGVWLVLVMLYGLYRSGGKADQDTIRPSGPLP